MKHNQKRKLFAQFLAGVTNTQEDKLLLNTPEVESMMRNQWDSEVLNSENIPKPDLFRILAAVYRRIAVNRMRRTQARTISLRQFYSVAAVVLLFLSLGSIMWYTGIIPGKNMVTIAAANGVRTEIFLPDGSRVWLNSNSSLKYNKNFDEDTRKLWLEGEAFFNISHNPSRPLFVKTKSIEVEVLGTRFNLLSVPNQKRLEATLVSGSIKLSSSNKSSKQSVQLIPGQKAHWNEGTNQFLVQEVNTSNVTRWVNNQLRFDNETFGNIVQQLEMTFGVKIEVPQELAQTYRFTATFTDESIFEIFNLLKITAPIDFLIKGNRVIVFKNEKK